MDNGTLQVISGPAVGVEAVRDIAPGPPAPSVPVVSNIPGRVLEPGRTLDAPYWRRHARQPVAFRSCIETFAGLGVDAVVEAHKAGLPISFDGLFAGETRRRISLPSYPFQWRRHWVETSRRRQASAGHPLLGVRHESPRGEVMFETEMFPSDLAWLDDHRGVAAGTESFSRYLAGEGVEAHSRAVLLADLEACRNPMRLRLCSGWVGSAGLAHR